MKIKTNILLVFCLLSASALMAQNGAHTLIASGPCNPIIPILCPSGVVNPNLAVDNDLGTAANMETAIGVLSGSFLKMGFATPAPSKYTVAVFVDQSTILNLDVLASISLTLYDAGGNTIKQKVGLTAADVEVDENNRGLLLITVPNNKSAASVQVSVGSLVTVLNTLNVYGAVYAPNNIEVNADYVYAQGPCNPITIDCPSGVQNASNAVDASKSNYALLVIPLEIAGSAYLDLGFTKPGPVGASVYFTLGTNSDLLDASLLDNLNMTVYDASGNVLKQQNGFTLADVTILNNGQFRIHLKVKKNANAGPARARVTLNSLLSVITDLRVYNAYYKGPINFSSYFPRESQSVEASIGGLMVYPSPASGVLNVNWNHLNSDNSAIVTIINLMGQAVYTGSINSGENKRIDISHLDNGIYMVHINNRGIIEDQKFVIQR